MSTIAGILGGIGAALGATAGTAAAVAVGAIAVVSAVATIAQVGLAVAAAVDGDTGAAAKYAAGAAATAAVGATVIGGIKAFSGTKDITGSSAAISNKPVPLVSLGTKTDSAAQAAITPQFQSTQLTTRPTVSNAPVQAASSAPAPSTQSFTPYKPVEIAPQQSQATNNQPVVAGQARPVQIAQPSPVVAAPVQAAQMVQPTGQQTIQQANNNVNNTGVGSITGFIKDNKDTISVVGGAAGGLMDAYVASSAADAEKNKIEKQAEIDRQKVKAISDGLGGMPSLYFGGLKV